MYNPDKLRMPLQVAYAIETHKELHSAEQITTYGAMVLTRAGKTKLEDLTDELLLDVETFNYYIKQFEEIGMSDDLTSLDYELSSDVFKELASTVGSLDDKRLARLLLNTVKPAETAVPNLGTGLNLSDYESVDFSLNTFNPFGGYSDINLDGVPFYKSRITLVYPLEVKPSEEMLELVIEYNKLNYILSIYQEGIEEVVIK